MNTEVAIGALKDVVSLLEKLGVDYWLGRGVFRHHSQFQELGQQTDIDFHILPQGAEIILNNLATFENAGYRLSRQENYVFTFKNEQDIEIDFVLLFPCLDNLVYHQSKSQRLICDRDCFGNRAIEMFGVKVRVPEERYLPQIYGTKWTYESGQTS